MRKASAALAALVCLLAFSSQAAARTRRGVRPSSAKATSSHKHKRVQSSHGHARRKASPKRHARIYQDIAGRVVLDRDPAPPVYGPFLPVEAQNYPQPLCEPMDAVVEATLHEPDADSPETPTAVAESEARGGEGLARIARKLGSFFRPKSTAAVVKPEDVDLSELVSRAFLIPVEGVNVEKLKDSFLSSRAHHTEHLAIDIGAPRGTPVVATTDGEIVRINREKRGGKSIYEKDTTGHYLLFYCHLSGYAEALAVGQQVQKGDVIGYVGSTGHVIGGPHLHFSITRLPDDSGSFKQGLAINPYLLFLAGVP